MKNYFAVSETGSDHEKFGIPCQDYAIARGHERCAMALAADGHGHPMYIRADRGAKFAVKAAEDVFSQAARHAERLLEEPWQEKLKVDLLENYRLRCLEDAGADPLSSAEMLTANPFEPIAWYGTTLCAVMTAENFTVCVAVGDGNIVLLGEDGQLLQPVPPPDTGSKYLVPGSMCQLSPRMVRMAVYPFAARAAMVTTDGWINSLSGEEEFVPLCHAVLNRMGQGTEGLADDMAAYVKKRVEQGKDDVSIAAFATVV